jgi:hypothetical protein
MHRQVVNHTYASRHQDWLPALFGIGAKDLGINRAVRIIAAGNSDAQVHFNEKPRAWCHQAEFEAAARATARHC